MPNQQIGVEVVAVGIAAFSRAMRTAQDDLERTSHAVTKASGAATGLGTALVNVGGNMQRFGRAMLIDVTAPLGILTGLLINAGIQFEDAFAGIGKTVGGVSVGFQEIRAAAQRELGVTVTTMDEARAAAQKLGIAFGDLTPVGVEVREQFRQMALEIPMASTELAELGELVGQLGVEAPEIAEVTELIAKLGLTTNMSSEDAAMSLIRMANIMRSTVGPEAISMAEFIQRAGSALVDLGNKSVATESEIMNFALRLSTAGDMAKMSEQEVLAWATTLADLGARAESGGTAVSRAIDKMIIAVQTGSEDLGVFAQVMGMTGAQFTKVFQDDASVALATFTQKLKEGLEAGLVTEKMLTAMGLGGVRAFDILGRLGNAEELLAKNTANANRAWAEAIALEEEAEKRFGTFKSQIQLLKNTFTDLGIAIFDLVEGDLENLLNSVKDALNWFKGLDDGLKRNIVIFAALAAVIGPLLIVFGGLISFLGMVVTGISALGLAALPVIAILGSLLAVAGAIAGINLFGATKTPAAPKEIPPLEEGIGTNETQRALTWQERRTAQTHATQREMTQAEIEAARAGLKRTPEQRGAWEGTATNIAQREMTQEEAQAIQIQLMIDETGALETLDSLKKNIADISQSVAGLKISDIIKDSGVLDSFATLKEFIVTSGLEWLKTTFENIKLAANGFTESLTGIIEDQGPGITLFFDNLKKLGDELQPLLISLGNLAEMFIGETDWEQFGTVLGQLAGLALEGLIESLNDAVIGLRAVVWGITEFSNWLQKAMVDVATFIDKIIEFKDVALIKFRQFFAEATVEVSEFPLKVIGKFEELKQGIITSLSTLWSGAKIEIQKFVDGFVNLISDLYQQIVGGSIIPDLVSEVLTWITNLKDSGLQIITDLVGGIVELFAGIKLPNLGGVLSGLTGGGGGGAEEEGTEGAGAEAGGDTAAMFNVQQIVALQEAVLGLQGVWASFGITVTTTLTTINQTLTVLSTLSKTLFLNMSLSFSEFFVIPTLAEILLFTLVFSAQMLFLSEFWRTICLGMVVSWLDFTANAAKLTPGFVNGVIGEFTRLKNQASGQLLILTTQFNDFFAAGGTGAAALTSFGDVIGGLKPKFAALSSAIAGFVNSMKAKLAEICAAANEAQNCVEGSPELKLQHPFELFEKYLKGISYGDLITKATSMPALENVTTVIPNLQGNTTNIDRSISSTITGVPLDTAENVAETMLRQIRMGEVLQG